MTQRKIDIRTIDGIVLRGELHEDTNAKAAVLFNPGTATTINFYRPFVKYLASHGYNVLLWNYRGFQHDGNSLKGSQFTYSDIGSRDVPAALAALDSEYHDLPIYCVGHSAGGQQIGFVGNNARLSGLVTLGVSGGYFPWMPLSYGMKAVWFFLVYGPIMSRVFGYVPAKSLKLMEDLPSGFLKEWGDWCLEKDYFFSKKYIGNNLPKGNFDNLPFPVHAFFASDDEIATPKNRDAYWKHVQSKIGITATVLDAANSPKGKLGHFGYVKRENEYIWQLVVEALENFKHI